MSITIHKILIEREEKQALYDLLNDRINELREQQSIKAFQYDKENVQGGIRGNAEENIVLKICSLDEELQTIAKEIERIDRFIKSHYDIAEIRGEEYKAILDKKIKGYTLEEIANEVSLSVSTVRRKLDDMGCVDKQK